MYLYSTALATLPTLPSGSVGCPWVVPSGTQKKALTNALKVSRKDAASLVTSQALSTGHVASILRQLLVQSGRQTQYQVMMVQQSQAGAAAASSWRPRTLCQACFSSVQFSRVQLFVTSWTAACQASLSITNSQSLLKVMSIESVMPSNHLILGRPRLLLPSIFASIRVFSSESVLCIRWPKD